LAQNRTASSTPSARGGMHNDPVCEVQNRTAGSTPSARGGMHNIKYVTHSQRERQ